MQMLKAGAVYFALVFGTGFVLGTIRTIWVVPRVGTRAAELMEMPMMLAVSILAARWTVLHRAVPHALSFDSRWDALRFSSCSSRSLGSPAGFEECRSGSMSQPETLCQGPFTTLCSFCSQQCHSLSFSRELAPLMFPQNPPTGTKLAVRSGLTTREAQ
jgi:hypothetical protein